jgi:peptidyl-prolyl cis-trans isomerase D
MFDLFRSRDKAVRYLLGALLGLVAFSMVITLIPGYGSQQAGSEQVLAEVGKETITVRQLQTTMQSVLRNKQIPPEMVQHYVPQLIDQMIAERAIAYQAERMGFRVSDADVALAIRSMLTQVFPNGEFNRDVYARFLGQQGMSIAEFERNVRTNLLLMKLQNIALEGAIVTPSEVEQEFRRRKEQVKVEYVSYNPGNLRSEVTATPQEIQNEYNQRKASYTVPEKRSFHLLIADEAKFAAALQLPESVLRAAYARNLDRYRLPERVHVRHILLNTVNKPKEEVAKLEAKANDLLKQLRAGADFAELAKKNSEDPGSAQKGGDLDWVTRGQMVKPFEETAFSLKPKEISNVIKTDYGFHIVQALEKEQARVKSFEEVRAELEAETKKDQVYQRMQSGMEQARAELSRNAQQAEQIAAKYGLTYAKADKVGVNESVPEVGTNPELENGLAVLRVGQVTPILQVAPTKLAVAAVTEILPPRPAQLSEVESQVKENVINRKVQELSDQRVKDMTAKFKAAGTDLNALAKSIGGQVKTTAPFGREGAAEGIGPATYLADAFTKPVGSIVGPINIGNQIILAKVVDKEAVDMSKLAAEREQIVTSLKRKKAAERRELFEDGLVTQLVKEGKVKKYQDNIRRVVNNYVG